MLSLCSVYIKAKITQKPPWYIRPYLSQPGFCLHINVDGERQTYVIFRGYCYFILFICEATNHVKV